MRRSVYSSNSSIVARIVVAPVPLDERLHPPHAGRVRRHLGAEVPRRLVLRADLREDELEDVLHDRAALDQLDRRDDHALLEDLLKAPIEAGAPPPTST